MNSRVAGWYAGYMRKQAAKAAAVQAPRPAGNSWRERLVEALRPTGQALVDYSREQQQPVASFLNLAGKRYSGQLGNVRNWWEAEGRRRAEELMRSRQGGIERYWQSLQPVARAGTEAAGKLGEAAVAGVEQAAPAVTQAVAEATPAARSYGVNQASYLRNLLGLSEDAVKKFINKPAPQRTGAK